MVAANNKKMLKKMIAAKQKNRQKNKIAANRQKSYCSKNKKKLTKKGIEAKKKYLKNSNRGKNKILTANKKVMQIRELKKFNFCIKNIRKKFFFCLPLLFFAEMALLSHHTFLLNVWV